jgi:23S rRNA pseudouridine1911/1915/1917 synthase
LLSVRLFTGRTHQIRVHLSQKGFPLWGDSVYGPADKSSPASRQLLHAWKLEFTHPVTGEEMKFLCPPPADFPHAMLALERGMKHVILTGMPGCGKSAVLDRLEARGIPVWSADKAVAAQYQPGADGWHLMRLRWRDAFFKEDGTVDRVKLTKLLAEAPGMRKELERIIHPLVRGSMEEFFLAAERRGLPAAVAEVPLWFEAGWSCEGETAVTVIACPDETRHARLHETRGWSDEKVSAVESWQWKQEDKIKAADFVIENGGTLEELDVEIGRFLTSLNERGEAQARELEASWQKLWEEPEAE